jgi:hypothetical protein
MGQVRGELSKPDVVLLRDLEGLGIEVRVVAVNEQNRSLVCRNVLLFPVLGEPLAEVNEQAVPSETVRPP